MGVGFPELFVVGTSYQLSEHFATGIQLNYGIVGQEDVKGTIDAGPPFPQGLVCKLGIGTSLVYYWRQEPSLGILEFPNAVSLQIYYIPKSPGYSDGYCMNIHFQSENISHKGIIKYAGLGFSDAKLPGIHRFLSPLLKIGIAYNFCGSQ